MAAVEHRERQEVQDREVEREEGHERQEPIEPEPRHLTGDLSDGQDAAHLPRRDLAQHEALEEAEHEARATPGLGAARDERVPEGLRHVHGVTTRPATYRPAP